MYRMITDDKTHHYMKQDTIQRDLHNTYETIGRGKQKKQLTKDSARLQFILYREVAGAQCCAEATPQSTQKMVASTTTTQFKQTVHHRHQRN